jgi:hypothetical protein
VRFASERFVATEGLWDGGYLLATALCGNFACTEFSEAQLTREGC